MFVMAFLPGFHSGRENRKPCRGNSKVEGATEWGYGYVTFCVHSSAFNFFVLKPIFLSIVYLFRAFSVSRSELYRDINNARAERFLSFISQNFIGEIQVLTYNPDVVLLNISTESRDSLLFVSRKMSCRSCVVCQQL